MTHRVAIAIAALLLSATSAALAQSRGPDTGTLVVAIPRDAAFPVPTLWAGENPNRETSDLIFLRLADLGPQLSTDDERKFVPRLARKWSRTDSVTLVFELDPRAKWQDGKPVVAADVIYAIDRVRNPKYGGGTTPLLQRIDKVMADGDGKVVFRFKQAYSEQLYDAVYHVPPLPSHLLASLDQDSLGTAAFVGNPVGNGPYRLVRRIPAQRIELASNPQFFLGTPKVKRLVFLIVPSADARANMLRAGEVDAIENVYTLPDPAIVKDLPDYRYYPAPGPQVAYVTFNHRNPADTSKPHTILADPVVRKAMVMAIDRERLAQSGLGPFTHAPSAPVSPLVARAADAPAPIAYNLPEAKRLLAAQGWRDSDNDGVLDKNGTRFALEMIVPATSAWRVLLASQIQEAYRQLGISIDLQPLEPKVYMPRRWAGNWDLEFWLSGQDPTPTGLVTSWSCTSSTNYNVGHYCNPVVDSLLTVGANSRTPVPAVWRQVVKRIGDDYPAIFVAAVVGYNPIHKRFERVSLRPESIWADVWKWSVKPGAQLERDKQ